MADLNDLQREWDSQPDYSETKMNEIAGLVRSRSDSMRSVLFARDSREVIAGVFIIVVFGSYWFGFPTNLTPNALAKSGIAIVIAGAVGIMVLMQAVRRRGRVDFATVPLKEFLASEVQSMNRQVALLRYVAWWYLLPPYVGSCLFVIGLSSAGDWDSYWLFSISYCVGYLIVCAFVWRLNQSARKKSLEPLRDALQRTYDSLVTLEAGGELADAEVVSALADPALDPQCRMGNWKFLKPSRWQVAVIVAATLSGAFCCLVFPIHGMGPRAFQSLVGGTLGFEITYFGMLLRRRVPMSRGRKLLLTMVLAAIVTGFVTGVYFVANEVEYPKRAPYSAIRWEQDEPVVRIGEEWVTLVSIDGVAADEIVAFGKRTYWSRWQKRFEEDLVEVLTRMGHPPRDTVQLVVRSRGSSTTRTLDDVPMMEANRWAIYGARAVQRM